MNGMKNSYNSKQHRFAEEKERKRKKSEELNPSLYGKYTICISIHTWY
jgi:hypothetical protein